MIEWLPVLGVVLVAAFVQGAMGFGFGLLAMAVLPWLLGFHVALALVAVFGFVQNVLLLIRYRAHFDLRGALALILGGLVGVPLGLVLLRHMEPLLATRVLGALVALYAAFELRRQRRTAPVRTLRPPRALDPWGLSMGLAGGLLGMAFNTGGPPVVAYGAARRWPLGPFKANLQAFFLVTATVQLTLYAREGLLTREVLEGNAVSAPVLLLGLWIGARLSEHLDGPSFRRMVLLALLVLGLAYLLR